MTGAEGNESEEPEQRIAFEAVSAFFFREMALGLFHNLGNILWAINSDLLVMQALTESSSSEMRQHTAQIVSRIREAKREIDRAQEFGRTLSPKKEEFYVTSGVLRETVRSISKASRLDVLTRTSYGQRDFVIRADRELFRQAVVVILDNAFDAVKRKKSRLKEVSVSVRPSGPDQIDIRIEDNGSGVPPELMKDIFRPYFTTRPSGLGLGLFFARSVVERFGGRLQLERNEVGKGATFTMTMPQFGSSPFHGRMEPTK